MMGFIDLPYYIFRNILKYVSLKQLLEIEQINKKFEYLIINNEWPHLDLIKIKSEDTLIIAATRHKFLNFNLSFCNISDASVKMLSNCHTLNLAGCYQITDKGLAHLKRVHT